MAKVSKQQTPVHTAELVQVIETSGLEPTTATNLQKSFLPFFEQLDGMEAAARAIVVTDEQDTETMTKAREARLQIRKIRIDADKKRKDLKENSIREGRAIQGVYNIIEFVVVPLEQHLQEQEDYAHVQQVKRMEAARESRKAEIAPYAEFVPVGIELGIMDQVDFEKLLKGAKLQQAAKEQEEKAAAQAEAERKRIEALHLERKVQTRDVFQFIPNEQKFDNWGEYSDVQWSALLEAIEANKKAEEVQKAEQVEALKKAREAEAAATAKADAERAEREKAQREADAKAQEERKANEAKLQEERDRAKKAEAELEAKRASEAAAEKERKAQEQAEADAKAKAEAAPDKEKLTAYLNYLARVDVPVVTSPGAVKLLSEMEHDLAAFLSRYKERVSNI